MEYGVLKQQVFELFLTNLGWGPYIVIIMDFELKGMKYCYTMIAFGKVRVVVLRLDD